MHRKKDRFEMEKTFGLDVLFKLTKSSVKGVEISEHHDKLRSNLGKNELADAVNETLKRHNIRLKIE